MNNIHKEQSQYITNNHIESPSTTINSPSEEQQLIIDHILSGKNVSVDACAGSGKSTTVFSCVRQMPPETRFLLITYNKMLRMDAMEKIRELGISNVEVHTFHSLAVKYYLPEAHTDCGIRKIIHNNRPPRITSPLPKYDVLVLDEAQDISLLYFQLAAKVMIDAAHPFQLFVLGDYMQCLYEFKGADTRFLTQYREIWHTHPYLKTHEFEYCTLRTSYRITEQMAHFVNNVMLGETRLIATKHDDPVVYITNSRHNVENTVVYHIRQLLESGAAQPDDIFVLGASTRGGQMKRMENVLVQIGVPCHVPIFETEEVDEKVISKKIVFSTFHSVKGRQRKYVFIVGFDNSYFNYYARNLNPEICPNTLYVGCTRALNHLFLLETNDARYDRPLAFLRMSHHEMRQQPYIKFKGTPKSVLYADQLSDATNGEEADDIPGAERRNNVYFITPTNLIRFIPETVLMKLAPLMDEIFTVISPETPEDMIVIPNAVATASGNYEEVSDLNGIAIPSIYYDHLWKKVGGSNADPEKDTDKRPTNREGMVFDNDALEYREESPGSGILYTHIYEDIATMRPNEHLFLKSAARSLPTTCTRPADYLYLANVYVSMKERIYFKLNQIGRNDYTWLTPDIIKKCISRLDRVIGPECRKTRPLIEHTVVDKDDEAATAKINDVLAPHFPPENGMQKQFRFTARADLITERCVWEIKCTSVLSDEHRLQLVIYAWLWRVINGTADEQKRKSKNHPMVRSAKLFNIKSGEMLKLDATMAQLTEIVVELLKSKYVREEPKTDEELWAECADYIADIKKDYLPEVGDLPKVTPPVVGDLPEGMCM